MCGIVGYCGYKQAGKVLLDCLAKLEYRGYDSCGIAVQGSAIEVYKDAVRVKILSESLPQVTGKTGIGHTRWATHGEPSRVNAHPHTDCTGKIAVVHNGVINNHEKLREQLTAEGHTFVSQTDSEVISHMVEKYYRGDLAAAVEKALGEIEGSYAIIVVTEDEKKLVAARKDSPLVIGVGDREYYLASDVPAFLDFTNRVIYMEEGDIASITPDGIEIKQSGSLQSRAEQKISWGRQDAQKAGYDHFMLKEIREQPRVIRDTLSEYISMSAPAADISAIGGGGMEDILILASGTSLHAAMVGKYIIEQLVQSPVRVEMASEFNYNGMAYPRNKGIVITQSGETADALKSIKRLKEMGCHVIAITNVVGSTASRIADKVVYTRAGPEISVPATKSFMAQLIALYWMALPYANVDITRLDQMRMELRRLPTRVQQVLDEEETIEAFAGELAKYHDIFFMSRGINYPIAMEGALKLKEISYLHAEGYSAGELKHGPFALLGPQNPVVAIISPDETYEAMQANIREVKARKAPVLAIAYEGDEYVDALADWVIRVPHVEPIFSPVVNTVVVQLLAYHVAKKLGCPIDYPRNLAKSVTVE